MSSFLRKDLVETVRQPRLVAALVLAPFLILLVFGTGLRDGDPVVATVFVVPEGDRLATVVERFATEPSWRLSVEAITQDQDEALGQLRRGEIDLVVVFPEGGEEAVRQNQQATVAFYHNLVDPLESRALGLATRVAVDRLNRQIVRSWMVQAQEHTGEADDRLASARARVEILQRAVDAGEEVVVSEQVALLQADLLALSLLLPATGLLDPGDLSGEQLADAQPIGQALGELAQGIDELSGQAQAGRDEVDRVARDLDRLDRTLGEFQALRPEVVVNPFRGFLQRPALVPIGLSDFFAPAVVVLLIQHMLVTLVGLSVVRDELLGTNDLFRVAPLTTVEVLVGKYVSHLLLGAGVSAVLIGLLVVGLGVPLVGSVPVLVVSVAALLFTAVGLGFVVALLARTDSQAVQYAMMVLLASIFLTGFLISLERFVPVIQSMAWLLPSTYGIALLRNVMLRGAGFEPLLLVGLVGIGLVLLGVSWLLLRRRLEPARVGGPAATTELEGRGHDAAGG